MKVTAEFEITEQSIEDKQRMAEIYDDYFSSHSDFKPNLNLGEVLTATICSINNTQLVVNTLTKHDIYVDFESEGYTADQFELGLELSLKIVQCPSHKMDYYIGSITEFNNQQIFNDLYSNVGNTEYTIDVEVVNQIPNIGYDVMWNGIKMFMPGSAANVNRLLDPTSIVNKTLPVVLISYTPEKDMFVVSHKEYLMQFVKQEKTKLQYEKKYTGVVTGVAEYGVFVQFNELLTGMIYKTDVDQNVNIKDFKVGSSVDFYIKSINADRILLTQTQQTDEWVNVKDNYKTDNTQYKGVIVAYIKYGLLIEFPDKIKGVAPDTRKHSIGETVNTIVTKINRHGRKMFLAIV